MNLQMNEGEQIDTFIMKWQKQLDIAISSNNNIIEKFKCEILMEALLDSWMTFTSILSKEKYLNLQDLVAKLKQDELRSKRTSSQHEVSHMAMATSVRNNRGNFAKPKFQRFQTTRSFNQRTNQMECDA